MNIADFKQKLRQNNLLVLFVFSITLFLSASLMFVMQPMVGRMLMPLVGGTPAAWIVTLSFFQIMLLLGYYLAHYLSRLDPKQQGVIYVILLAVALGSLPVSLARHANLLTDDVDPFNIFAVLGLSLGAPFVVLSATSSTIQRLFTATGHKAAEDPYFLYAASNLGSFGGLFLYPFVIERLFGIQAQSFYWLFGYISLIALVCFCLFLTGKTVQRAEAISAPQEPVTRQQRLRWILYAFMPSSLMMGVTTHITTDVFAAPMIWILPLGFYLLTFVMAFARRRLVSTKIAHIIHPVAVVASVGMMTLGISPSFNVAMSTAFLHVGVFALVALSCHTMLADQRPSGTARQSQLTDFYLMIAIGGALGGVLNAFILPLVLDRAIEYMAMMLLSLILLPGFKDAKLDKKSLGFLGASLVLVGLFAASSMNYLPPLFEGEKQKHFVNAIILTTFALGFASRKLRILFLSCTLIAFVLQIAAARVTVLTARNFYGVVKIFDIPLNIHGTMYPARTMSHGTTTHGMQVLHDLYSKDTSTYYEANGPVGDVFKEFNPKDIAVVGLGTGTMNCHSTPENAFTFIDIDKDVVDIATSGKYFTYMQVCRGRKSPEIVIGDGRLVLQKMTDRKFDVIVLDGFTADTVPVHLMTEEAINIYLDRLNPGGVLLFNASNRYFNLGGALAGTAEKMNLHARMKIQVQPETPLGVPSVWLVIGRGDVDYTGLENRGWGIMMVRPEKPWTDDYADTIGMMHLTF